MWCRSSRRRRGALPATKLRPHGCSAGDEASAAVCACVCARAQCVIVVRRPLRVCRSYLHRLTHTWQSGTHSRQNPDWTWPRRSRLPCRLKTTPRPDFTFSTSEEVPHAQGPRRTVSRTRSRRAATIVRRGPHYSRCEPTCTGQLDTGQTTERPKVAGPTDTRVQPPRWPVDEQHVLLAARVAQLAMQGEAMRG